MKAEGTGGLKMPRDQVLSKICDRDASGETKSEGSCASVMGRSVDKGRSGAESER